MSVMTVILERNEINNQSFITLHCMFFIIYVADAFQRSMKCGHAFFFILTVVIYSLHYSSSFISNNVRLCAHLGQLYLTCFYGYGA